MSAKEVLEWIVENYSNEEVMIKCFGKSNKGIAIDDYIDSFGAGYFVEKIERYVYAESKAD